MHWETETDVCELPYVKQKAGGKLLYSAGSSAQCSVMAWRGGMGGRLWEGGSRGDDICMHTADSHCCTAETNTTL